MNVFGRDFAANGYVWNKTICEKDSDGDGKTNGEELGDPCCFFEFGDVQSEYSQTFTASHPGFKEGAQPASYSRPSCDSTKPAEKGIKLGLFNKGERQFTMDFKIDNYLIPTKTTTYIDVAWNWKDDAFPIYHVVKGEAIILSKKWMHHYVISGCRKSFPKELAEKQISGKESSPYQCNLNFGQWAPGQKVVETAPWMGVAVGRDASIVGFLNNVHFNNPDQDVGIHANDGMTLWYTPDLRPDVYYSSNMMSISYNPMITIHKDIKRFFMSRTCKLKIKDPASRIGRGCWGKCGHKGGACNWCGDGNSCCRWHDEPGDKGRGNDGNRHSGWDKPACKDVTWHDVTNAHVCVDPRGLKPNKVNLFSIGYHAHLLGSEMYGTLTFNNGTTMDFSQPIWHYDDEVWQFVLNRHIVLESGDTFQVTCVFDSTRTDRPTAVGLATYDEMCWASLAYWPPLGVSCEGKLWMGNLTDYEDARGIGVTHHMRCNAKASWTMHSLFSGGFPMKPPACPPPTTILTTRGPTTTTETTTFIWDEEDISSAFLATPTIFLLVTFVASLF